jgi:trimeric autotransporter adhesin
MIMTTLKLPSRATWLAHATAAWLFAACVLGSGPASADACAGFLDVEDADPFCTHVEWIRNRGITLGCTTDQYCPHSAVTRMQMAAFMHRLGNVTFQQGGNAFGQAAVLGTVDFTDVEIHAANSRIVRYVPNAAGPNIIAGDAANSAQIFYAGQTIAGGGRSGNNCLEPSDGTFTRSCANLAKHPFVVIGGGLSNTGTKEYATVAGGLSNTAGGVSSTVAGGEYHRATGNYATVGGGQWNVASGPGATVAGGAGNLAAGFNSTIGGGDDNEAGDAATVAGGLTNVANGAGATSAGGSGNAASGQFAAVPGGHLNKAIGHASFVAGRNGTAAESGMFVWSDSRGFEFNPVLHRAPGESANTFNVRATGHGGVWFVTGVNAIGTPTWACYAQNGNGWTCASDRNLKRNLEPIDGAEVLAKLAAMPIYRWQPKDGPNADVTHAGPMAQDFHAAFGLGDNDKAIGLQDADGVALAAIKGLHQLVQQQARDLERLRGEIAAQRAELASRITLSADTIRSTVQASPAP